MKKLLPLITLCLFGYLALIAQEIPTFSPEDIDIPYQQYTLDNGLTLIVHEDHKAPIVAVNVWYHVGSKNEKPGKSGFAHLFEHLMFNGSEHYDDDYFQALERIGATDLNGTTNNDRTNYFQNVPLAALDQVLWLESDRMGHLLGAIDQEKLDEQRGVVQNEKRQGQNQPYGRQYDLLIKALFPPGHPYSWTVIGEMEHLNAASLDDVHEWFKTYYGTANAVLSIAGDVNADEIHEKVKKYFGSIAPGPTLVRPDVNVPHRTGETRQVYEDRVPESRIVMAWNTAEWGNMDSDYLDLASDVLARGKNSRLYKKLVYEDQSCSRVSAFQWSKEIAGNFMVQANIKPGNSVEDVEKAINEVLADFLKNGPTAQELKRVKAAYFSGFIKGIERIGGFGGKSDILASNMVYGGSPEAYKVTLQTIADATAEDVRKTCNKWLSDGKHVLICNPFPEFTASTEDVDRSKMPELGAPVAAKFPGLQEATLSNGMKVVLAKREGVPTVVMNMLFDAGYATDSGDKAGRASVSMNMMDEGTKKMNALQINEQLSMLGASLSSGSDLDASYINMTTLKPSLDASLDLYADVLLNPAFPAKEFDRLKKDQQSQIKREKATPIQMALRVFPQYLYGKDHAYSLPLTGSGFEKSIEGMTLEDVQDFYNDWIKPNNATLVVVGDLEMDALKAKLEKKFGGWKKGDLPKKEIAEVPVGKGKKLYLMDRAESQQSVIIAGYLTTPYGKIPQAAEETMINVFGGQFTSRLNLNLREDKHWSYGARCFTWDAKGQRPFVAYAPVQTDKTKESIQEIIKEFKMVIGEKPIMEEEVVKNTTNSIMELPGRWETNRSVANSVVEIEKYDLPKDYYQNYDQMMRSLKTTDVQEVAKQIIHPEQLNWFVVGDKAKILEGLKELDFDEIILVDGDGNPLETLKKGEVKP